MTETELSRIETELGLALPAEYRQVIAAKGPTLLRLASDYTREVDRDGAVYLMVEDVINNNLRERADDSDTSYAFPEWSRTYVMIGTNGAGGFFCLRLDGTPGVWLIGSDCGDDPSRVSEDFSQHAEEYAEFFREAMQDSASVAPHVILQRDAWVELRQEVPDFEGLGESFAEFEEQTQDRRYRLRQQRKDPIAVVVSRGEFLPWCAAKSRAACWESLTEFCYEKLIHERPWVGKRQ